MFYQRSFILIICAWWGISLLGGHTLVPHYSGTSGKAQATLYDELGVKPTDSVEAINTALSRFVARGNTLSLADKDLLLFSNPDMTPTKIALSEFVGDVAARAHESLLAKGAHVDSIDRLVTTVENLFDKKLAMDVYDGDISRSDVLYAARDYTAETGRDLATTKFEKPVVEALKKRMGITEKEWAKARRVGRNQYEENKAVAKTRKQKATRAAQSEREAIETVTHEDIQRAGAKSEYSDDTASISSGSTVTGVRRRAGGTSGISEYEIEEQYADIIGSSGDGTGTILQQQGSGRKTKTGAATDSSYRDKKQRKRGLRSDDRTSSSSRTSQDDTYRLYEEQEDTYHHEESLREGSTGGYSYDYDEH